MPEKVKLLIVDDETQFVDSIARRLEMRGFDVTKAYGGQQAVDAARGGKFDLALLDLKMPGLDGRQVLEILKREHKFLEIIILTGHGSLESAVECTKLGAFGYLPKPYELVPRAVVREELAHARHGVHGHLACPEHLPAKMHQACVVADVGVREEDSREAGGG